MWDKSNAESRWTVSLSINDCHHHHAYHAIHIVYPFICRSFVYRLRFAECIEFAVCLYAILFTIFFLSLSLSLKLIHCYPFVHNRVDDGCVFDCWCLIQLIKILLIYVIVSLNILFKKLQQQQENVRCFWSDSMKRRKKNAHKTATKSLFIFHSLRWWMALIYAPFCLRRNELCSNQLKTISKHSIEIDWMCVFSHLFEYDGISLSSQREKKKSQLSHRSLFSKIGEHQAQRYTANTHTIRFDTYALSPIFGTSQLEWRVQCDVEHFVNIYQSKWRKRRRNGTRTERIEVDGTERERE